MLPSPAWWYGALSTFSTCSLSPHTSGTITSPPPMEGPGIGSSLSGRAMQQPGRPQEACVPGMRAKKTRGGHTACTARVCSQEHHLHARRHTGSRRSGCLSPTPSGRCRTGRGQHLPGKSKSPRRKAVVAGAWDQRPKTRDDSYSTCVAAVAAHKRGNVQYPALSHHMMCAACPEALRTLSPCPLLSGHGGL